MIATVQPRVDRFIDFAHSPSANRGADFVRAELCVWRKAHRAERLLQAGKGRSWKFDLDYREWAEGLFCSADVCAGIKRTPDLV